MNIGGKKIPAWAAWGGGIGGGLVLFIYFKNRASSGSSSGSSGGSESGTDPATGLPYSEDDQEDPLTGMTYLAEAQEYGSVSAAEAALSENAYSDSGESPYYGTAGYPTENVGYTQQGGNGYTSNAQWSQAVQAGLSDLGYSSETVASALGLYLNNMPLNATDTSIIQAAVAEYGEPPVGSYSIIQQGNGTGSSGATVSVPNVVGMPIDEAGPAIAGLGLVYHGPSPVPGKTVTIISQSPAGGSQVAQGTVVTAVGNGGGSGSGSSGGTVTVPNVVGKPIDQAGPMITGAGLKWDGPAPVKGKTVTVTSQNPAAGSKVAAGTTVRATGKTS